MFIFFNILYWLSAISGKILIQWLSKKNLAVPVDNHALYQGQKKKEIQNSLVSIIVFSIQGIIIQQGIQHGWLYISYNITWHCLLQMFILFFWNEIHFYFVHRLLHTLPLARLVHSVHHHSKEPTVFSTYSFHWVEAFLLGTVIVFPLAVYPFQLPALIFLPVMSSVLNTLGHCNYELFPGQFFQPFFRFSKRHSMHHKKGNGNYGFMLTWFDGLFNTAISKKIKE